jgi:kanamycin nucleotidyltransferase
MNENEAKRILSLAPQSLESFGRRVAVEQVVSRLDSKYGDSIVAIGLYGSTARDADREFSDVELFCVVKTSGRDQRLESAHAPCKYEVELFGEEVIRRKAAELDETWSVTHFAYVNPKPASWRLCVFS